jgi:hypothetical protein
MNLQQINELFTQPYDYKWTMSISNQKKAEFKTENGDLVEVLFGHPIGRDDNLWGMMFSRNDSTGKTSEGDAVRIFTTVIKIAGDFINKVKPAKLFFTAEKSADRRDQRPNSRINLYTRLVNKFAEKAGYNVEIKNQGFQFEYILTRKNMNEEAAGVGKITKQNTTVDVKPGETARQAAKFGNKINKKNEPPLLHKKAAKNSTPHVLTNLGLGEEITTIRGISKDDKLGVKFNHFDKPTGKKIGQIEEIEVWHSNNLEAGYSGMLLWDPTKEQAAGVVFFKKSLSSNLQNLHPKTVVISTAAVNTPYEGRGLIMKAYVKLLKKGYAIVSDDIQSQGGIKIWQRLAKTQGIHVYAVDMDKSRPRFSAIDPNDTSDADFMVYADDRNEMYALDREYKKLKREYNELIGWLTDADDLISSGHEDEVDADEYEDIEDQAKAMKYEITAIEKELAAMGKHVDSGSFGADTRLMAVAEKPRKKTSESIVIKKPHPKDTLGIKRKDMPQIHKDHYPEFIRYLKSHGARVSMRRVHATELRPVQSEFSDKGVEKMMRNTNPNKGTTRDKPLIVSSDNYIIDGHHRWLAAYNLDEEIPIMQFSIPIKKLFQLVKDFRHTTYKDIREEVVTEALKDAYPYDISNEGPQVIKAWFDAAKGSTVTAQMAVMDDYYLATLAHYADFDIRDVQGVTGDDVWEFFFKRDGSVELTNKGDQFKIFATVVSIFREFVKRKKPKVIAFSSSKHEEGGKGRTPLYKRFAAAFAKESGYRLKEFDLFDEYYFLLFAPGIQIESMSVLEQACLEGGHIYERDLEEIAKIPPLKNDDANMQRMPQRIKQIKDGLFTKITELNDKLDLYMSNDLARYGRDGYVMVVDKAVTTVMSFLRVYSAGNMVVYAGMAWTHPQHRRQGLATILYEALLSKGLHLETDSSQTTSGKAIWKHLISKHGGYLMRDGKVDRPVKTDKDFEQAYKRNAPYNYTLLIKSPQSELNLGESVLKEVFDNPYPYEWKRKTSDLWRAVTELDDGSELKVSFVAYNLAEVKHSLDYDRITVNALDRIKGNIDAWDIIFSRNDVVSATKMGDQQRIFATVVAAMNEWFQSVKPEVVMFSSEKADVMKDGSRAKLYQRFARMLAAKTGYKSVVVDADESKYFFLINRSLTENISITGTITSKEDRKRNLIPGSDDWFKHWFSLPYLRREDVDRLKEEAVGYIKNRKGVKNEEETRYRRNPRNRRTNERRRA